MAVALVYTKKGLNNDKMTDVHLFSPVHDNAGKEHYTLDPVLLVAERRMDEVGHIQIAGHHDFVILDYAGVIKRATMMWLVTQVLVFHATSIPKIALQMQLLQEASDNYKYHSLVRMGIDAPVDELDAIWKEVCKYVEALAYLDRSLEMRGDRETPHLRITDTMFMARYGGTSEHRLYSDPVIVSDLKTA